MDIKYRPYQKECIQANMDFLTNRSIGNPLSVLPTAAGKSIVINGLILELLKRSPNARFIILAHVKELVQQNHDKMKLINPELDLGIYSAGIGSRDTDHAVIYAGIQSVFNKSDQLGGFDYIIVDEAHRIPCSGLGTYRRFMLDQYKLNHACRVIGFTATPFRTGKGYIHQMEKSVLSDLVFEIGIDEMIEQGYLTKPIPITSKDAPDFSKMAISQGDYKDSDQEAAYLALVPVHTDQIIKYTAEQKRNHTIIFCVSVEHVHAVCNTLTEKGFSCAAVTGSTPKNERDQIIHDFNEGMIQFIVNCAVFTEGFDSPIIDCVALLRGTKSPGLYVQCVGRGLRLHDSKKDCLVLDFGRNVLRHGPLDNLIIDQVKKKKGIDEEDQEPKKLPTKKCPNCKSRIFISLRQCSECGYEFAEPEKKLDEKPSNSALISDTKKRKEEKVKATYEVERISYKFHIQKKTTKTFLVATYHVFRVTGFQDIHLEFKQYLALDPEEKMFKFSQHWIKLHFGFWLTDPKKQFFDFDFSKGKVPPQIKVTFDGKFPKIKEIWE